MGFRKVLLGAGVFLALSGGSVHAQGWWYNRPAPANNVAYTYPYAAQGYYYPPAAYYPQPAYQNAVPYGYQGGVPVYSQTATAKPVDTTTTTMVATGNPATATDAPATSANSTPVNAATGGTLPAGDTVGTGTQAWTRSPSIFSSDSPGLWARIRALCGGSNGNSCPAPGMSAAPGTANATEPGAMPGPLAFGQAPEAGGDVSGTLVPNMFGDMGPHMATYPAPGVLIDRGAYKIADNQSPRPQDRVFGSYNYYNDVYPCLNTPGTPNTNLDREVVGFEKTFLGGDASFGMRLPFVQMTGGAPGTSQSGVGDLTMFGTYAFINDRQTGNVLSGGLALTVPSGKSFVPNGTTDVHDTLIQPYVAGIYNMGKFFVQGFSAIVVPTCNEDVTLWNNDLGVGYRLYQPSCDEGRIISYVVPTAEIHISTPLDHHGLQTTTAIPGIDIVDFTFGVTIGLGDRSSLGIAVNVPVTGPQPYTWEGMVQFNFRL